jgi:hypothetical protein
MWKIALAFVAFAALAMFILMKSGGDIDMGGEKHGVESHEPAAHAASAVGAAASAAAPAASAASN